MRLGFTTLVLAVLSGGAVNLRAQIVNDTWTGTGPGTNWGTAANWTNGVPPGPPTTTNVFFILNTGAFTSTVDNAYTIANLDIGGVTTSAFTLNSSGGSALTITNQFSNQDANPVSVNVSIQGGGEFVMGLFGAGVGTLTLNSTNNTWSGVTRIDSGTFADGQANAFSPNSLLTVANPGVVQANFNEVIGGLSDDIGGHGSVVIPNSGTTLTMAGSISSTFTGVISGNGGIAMNATGTLGLSGNNTYTGPTVIGPGAAISIGFVGQETGSLASPSVSGAGALEFLLSGNYTYPGSLSGALNVAQQGAGVTTLSGTSNTYSGLTTVTAGELQDGAANAFSPNSLVEVATPSFLVANFNESIGWLGSNNGAVIIANSGTTLTMTGNGGPYNTAFSGSIGGGGGLDLQGNNSLTLTGANNNYSGPTTLEFGSTLVLGNGGATGTINSPSVSGGGTLEFNLSSDNNYAGVISGSTNVTQQGTGTTILSGGNTYFGNTTVNAGILADGAPNSFSANSPMIVNAGATLDVNFNDAVGGLSALDTGGAINIANGATLTDDVFVDPAFPGTITGAGSLVINGNGFQTLSGNNTYSGGTMVSAELFVGSSTNGPPGSFTAGPVGTGILTFQLNGEFSPSAPNVTLANTIVLNDDGFVENIDGGSNNLTLTGQISGPSGFDWWATGTFELTGANTFVSGVDMREGTLLLGSSTVTVLGSIISGPIGTGDLTLESGTVVAAAIPSVTLANPIDLAGNTQLGSGVSDANALSLTGQITGAGNITYSANSAGSLTLGGANSFSGSTTINGGTVFAANDQAFAPGNPVVVQALGGQTANLSVNSGVTIANSVTTIGSGNVISGSGTFAAPVTIDGTVTLSPGSPLGSPLGTLTFSSGLTLATNGSISFNLIDANGAPGTGFGNFSVTGGSLNMTANAGTLAFNVNTINAGGLPAMAVNFNSANSYSWMFGSSSSAISGFLPGGAQFNILTAGFMNPTNAGTFSISENGMNQLFLNFTPVPEPSTWALLGSGVISLFFFALYRRRRRA